VAAVVVAESKCPGSSRCGSACFGADGVGCAGWKTLFFEDIQTWYETIPFQLVLHSPGLRVKVGLILSVLESTVYEQLLEYFNRGVK
jgi:hypothetical protein